MVETKKTFCRFCHVFCGLEVDVEDNKIIAVRGDHDNPISEGYTCPKGRAEVEPGARLFLADLVHALRRWDWAS